jgi:hypothetical protein
METNKNTHQKQLVYHSMLYVIADMEELKEKFDKLQVSIMNNNMKEELNGRGIGGSDFHTNWILQGSKETTDKMIRQMTTVGGTLASTNTRGIVLNSEIHDENQVQDFIIEDKDVSLNDDEHNDNNSVPVKENGLKETKEL